MRCETCCFGCMDSAKDWGYCQITGDDVTAETVCDQWAPETPPSTRLGPTDYEGTQ